MIDALHVLSSFAHVPNVLPQKSLIRTLTTHPIILDVNTIDAIIRTSRFTSRRQQEAQIGSGSGHTLSKMPDPDLSLLYHDFPLSMIFIYHLTTDVIISTSSFPSRMQPEVQIGFWQMATLYP
ncbi:hypothetical protein CDAR_128481 [Caerostris darwini]|uniref:Uncharacterized protein n=1 Tax=Caerostris darwini TaxID=1538125 RepID=A0AAV4PG80_9ARAC|nr:hypothetical protein CDAR_128481 [Caerostris darwini]